MSGTDPLGHWAISGAGFTVERRHGRLWATFAGIDGVGMVLHPDGDGWIAEGGPVDGARLELSPDGGSIGGIIPIDRLDVPPRALDGADIRAPVLTEDPSRDVEFDRIWSSADGPIDWSSSRPKHEFVQWLMARGEVVFHGSNTRDITRFSTARKSVELDDPTGRGNLTAVYATPDGLWAMYFAVTDRSRIRGSLRNGVASYVRPDGGRETRYHLSLATLDLDLRPFATGTLYFLPRDRFEPIPLHVGGPPTMEWACHEPVDPIASLDIAPDDYPLLDEIGGHDETDRIRYGEAATTILDLVVEIVETEPELRLRLAEEPPENAATDYAELGRIAWPGTDRRVDGTLVTIEGPIRYRQAIADRVRRRLG